MGRPLAVAIVAAALLGAASMAFAAGLGRLTVLSALGAPLNAEIEVVSLQPGEEDNLTARVAPPQAFKQAGIEFNPVLLGVRFALERRGNLRLLRITSTQPVNEPFLDLLVELQWPTGRLVREYSVLLDPPGYKGAQPIAAAPPPPPPAPAAAPQPPADKFEVAEPATPREVKPAPPLESRPLEPAPATNPEPTQPQAEPQAEENAAEETVNEEKAAAQGAQPSATPLPHYQVQKGDTLVAIARKHLPPGVTLNQMLLAIYRENEDAFVRENLNLLRSGRILVIPETEAVGTVNVEEANELVKAHADEFNAYRARLAAVPAAVESGPGERSASGQIESKPQAAAPAVAQDQVKLAKNDPRKPEAVRAARDDDMVARERALKEAQSRITDLERNVADLQKLLELKNQQLAEMEKKATAKPAPAPAPAPKPAPPNAAASPAPSTVPTTVPPVATAPQTATPPQPEAAKPPAPAAAKPPAPAPKPKAAPPPPPPPPPSLLDELLDNQLALVGLGSIVLLVLGYIAWSARRRKATRAKFQDSVLGAAAAGGAASTTVATAPASQGASSQGAVGALEAEDVDPIAEADVYMAYGRDAQAEEILKEALQKDGRRPAIHVKLLEIFAKRQDTQAFEQTAVKLKSMTNGAGADWEKAAALGRSIDPQNSLYGGGADVPAAPPPVFNPPPVPTAPTVDFDLGGATSAGMIPDIPLDEPKKSESSGLDFDLGAATGTEKSDFAPAGTFIREPRTVEATVSALDFDLGETKPAVSAAAATSPAGKSEPSAGLDFDLNLDLDETRIQPENGAPAAPDLSSISLDLGSAGEPAAAGGTDPKWQEVATKLDLAKAYEEMGDKDGARELLNEVMKDGDAAQRGQAEQILAKLG